MAWRWYNIYEVIDVETGEILTPPINKKYITVKIETKTEVKINGKYETDKAGNQRGLKRTIRYVKHNGQQELFH